MFLFPVGLAYSMELPATEEKQTADINGAEEEKEDKGLFELVAGQPAQNSLYLGMWSYHFVNDDESYQNTHNLIGLTYKGFFAGTFENSRDERAWAAGFQRDLYQNELSMLNVAMGYRIGLMHGYDKMQIFDSGFYPLLQLYSEFSYKKAGVQLSWAGSVVTAGFFLRL
jgi:hypothetical protein